MEIRLAELLRAMLFASSLPFLILLIPSFRLTSVHGAIVGIAKRGKIMQSSNRFTVPQRFFWHFYMLATVLTTLLLLMTWCYAYKVVPLDSESLHYSTVPSHLNGGSHIFSEHMSNVTSLEHRYRVWRSVFLLILMDIHVLRRLYETLFVFNYSPSARMHIFAYITGLLYYAAAPLSLCCPYVPEVLSFVADQVAELSGKGGEMMQINEFNLWESVKPFRQLVWYQWMGAAIFVWGWTHQRRCHSILGSLRKRKEQADEYIVPYGDWFEIVSSPHYLAEIVIYAGLLFTSGGTDLTIWLLFILVVANLVYAAAETHKWYIQKFEKYPCNRRAIIPYVF